jgi:hypothetical protein
MRLIPSRIVRFGSPVLALVLLPGLAGCESMPRIVGELAGQPEIRCGRFEGPGCARLVDLGRNQMRRGDQQPSIVAVGGACPDNARCLPSALGGEEAAVVVRWPDGTTDWVTIPLPADWPAGAPGEPVQHAGVLPDHLEALVGAGG